MRMREFGAFLCRTAQNNIRRNKHTSHVILLVLRDMHPNSRILVNSKC